MVARFFFVLIFLICIYGNEDFFLKQPSRYCLAFRYFFHIITFMYFAYLYHKNVLYREKQEKKSYRFEKVVLVLLRRWRRKTRLWNISCEKTVFEFLEFYVIFFLLFFKITFKLKWDCWKEIIWRVISFIIIVVFFRFYWGWSTRCHVLFWLVLN